MAELFEREQEFAIAATDIEHADVFAPEKFLWEDLRKNPHQLVVARF